MQAFHYDSLHREVNPFVSSERFTTQSSEALHFSELYRMSFESSRVAIAFLVLSLYNGERNLDLIRKRKHHAANDDQTENIRKFRSK